MATGIFRVDSGANRTSRARSAGNRMWWLGSSHNLMFWTICPTNEQRSSNALGPVLLPLLA